ncbi:MAG: PHB depolymerase family esterase [Isosphaeraceae bacterium]
MSLPPFAWWLEAARLILASPFVQAPPADPLRHAIQLESAGHTWSYFAQLPGAPQPETRWPVVLVLHGAGGEAREYLDGAGWAKKAKAAGFLAIAPEGLPKTARGRANFWTNPRLWNTGSFDIGGDRMTVDDLAFFRDLLDDIARRWPIDPERISIAGHSNGGSMAFRLGWTMPERFAAIAAVASPMPIREGAEPPAQSIPSLFLIGNQDTIVPLAGGVRTLPWGKSTVPPIEPGLTRWAKGQGCSGEGRTRSDEDGLKVVEYGPGREGVPFTAYFLEGQGHGWPGADSSIKSVAMGPVSNRLNATELIWDFFQGKRRTR